MSNLKLITAPTVEPVTLTEIKTHLNLDSGDLDDNITTTQSIAPGAHTVIAAYGLEGTAVNVLGYQVMVLLEAGDCSAGTVTVKLQHRDALTDDWADVLGGAFTAVNAANDNATQQLVYSGGKTYLRAAATVATGTCYFGVSVQSVQPYSADDVLLTALIQAAREYCEDRHGRAYTTQTRELVLDEWPTEDYIELPRPPLASVTSVKYKNSAGLETTWAASNYIADTDSYLGRVVLAYGNTWPTEALYPASPIKIQYICGGAAASVPESVKNAIKLHVQLLYDPLKPDEAALIEKTRDALLGMNRVVPV